MFVISLCEGVYVFLFFLLFGVLVLIFMQFGCGDVPR